MHAAVYVSFWLCLSGPSICRAARDPTWLSSGDGFHETQATIARDDFMDFDGHLRKLLQDAAQLTPGDSAAPDAGANPTDRLSAAVGNGDLAAVQEAISAGGDVNANPNGGLTLLGFASASKNYDVMKALLAAGADVSLPQSGTGEQPIHTAAIVPDNVEGLTILLDNGADVNALASQIMTPVLAAAAQGHKGNIEFLIARGAQVLGIVAQTITCICVDAARNEFCNVSGCENDKASILALFN